MRAEIVLMRAERLAIASDSMRAEIACMRPESVRMRAENEC